MANTFTRLTIRNWRQFRYVDIKVHPRATILTGANGAGKSTILGIFGQHFGVQRPLVGTPNAKGGVGWLYDSGFYDAIDDDVVPQSLPSTTAPPSIVPPFFQPPMGIPSPTQDTRQVGTLSYSNGIVATIAGPKSAANYGLNISPQQPAVGLSVSSHRVVAPYQQIQQLPLQAGNIEGFYNAFVNELNVRYLGHQTQFSPLYRMKEAIVALAAFGEGNSFLPANPELLNVLNDFVAALRIMLPDDLGFDGLQVRTPDIVLQTNSGEFVVDASSGGIGSILELTWQLLMFSRQAVVKGSGETFYVLMDEPENHLHPTMQRTLLPKLLKAFPMAMFIVATHSPFVVSSVEDSLVYALRYRQTRIIGSRPERSVTSRVYSTLLDNITKAGTAAEILREVLGVPVTFPEWANEKLERIVRGFHGQKLDKSAISRLRTQLETAGLIEYYPQALDSLVSAQ